MVDVIYYNLLFFFISKLVLHDNTEKGLHPCLLVTLSSSLQAHHTVWRKLRQRAEKLVRTTVISLSYLTLFQRQWHQSQSTEANSGKEGCQCFGAAAWSRCWILSKLAPGPQPPWLPPSLLIAQSSQRTGFNGCFFFYCFAFIFWQKNRASRLNMGCGVEEKGRCRPRREGQTAAFRTRHQRRSRWHKIQGGSIFKSFQVQGLILRRCTSQIDAAESALSEHNQVGLERLQRRINSSKSN